MDECKIHNWTHFGANYFSECSKCNKTINIKHAVKLLNQIAQKEEVKKIQNLITKDTFLNTKIKIIDALDDAEQFLFENKNK